MSTVLGEFAEEAALLGAARRLRELGHARVDLHSPVPIAGAEEALGLSRSAVPLIGLVGGLAGVGGALLMQWWMNAVDYPLDVGGRSMFSWPAWVPVTFESMVALASLAIFFGFLGLAGFPRPHHPVFEVEAFRSAAVDALWISAEVERAKAESVAEELRRLGAKNVSRVDDEEEP